MAAKCSEAKSKVEVLIGLYAACRTGKSLGSCDCCIELALEQVQRALEECTTVGPLHAAAVMNCSHLCRYINP